MMSDYEEDLDDFPSFMKTIPGRIFGCSISRRINGSMDSCMWNHYENCTIFIWWVNFLVQVWGADWWLAGSYSAWKKENEAQHWITDLSEMQKCIKDFAIKNLWEQKMESSILAIRWDTISSKELRVFSSGDFINLSDQEEETLRWSCGSASSHCSWIT